MSRGSQANYATQCLWPQRPIINHGAKGLRIGGRNGGRTGGKKFGSAPIGVVGLTFVGNTATRPTSGVIDPTKMLDSRPAEIADNAVVTVLVAGFAAAAKPRIVAIAATALRIREVLW